MSPMVLPTATLSVAGVVVITVALLTFVAGDPDAMLRAATELVSHAWLPALWLLSSLGWGTLAIGARVGETQHARLALQPQVASQLTNLALRWGVGTALLLALDQVIGVSSLVSWGAAPYFLLHGVGIAVLVRGCLLARGRIRCHLPISPVLLLLGVPCAVLLLASVSPPGWLWRSEFAGYDALSYHLQLPKEWLESGQIATLPHNVYSALPSFTEGAFLDLMTMASSAHAAAVDSQILCAGWTLIAAMSVAAAAIKWCCSPAREGDDCGRRSFDTGMTAALIFLITPWVLVTGSLAYNESATMLVFATILLVLAPCPPAISSPSGGGTGSLRQPLLLGVLMGVVLGCKLSSAAILGVPTAVLALVYWLPKLGVLRTLCYSLLAVSTCLLVLLPWLTRNTIATGNALFPLASEQFGAGWWTAAQAAAFHSAHAPSAPSNWPHALWHEFLAYGWFDCATVPGVGFLPQWGVLPLFALIAVPWAIRSPQRQSILLLTLAVSLGVVGWLLFTHQKSRFLVPLAIPMAMIVGHFVSRMMSPRDDSGRGASAKTHAFPRAATLALLGALTLLPASIYLAEGRAHPTVAIGNMAAFKGGIDLESEASGASGPVALLNSLDVNERVLAVGFSNPFYVNRTPAYSTVWDNNPLDEIAAALPDSPQLWGRELADSNFTVLILNREMLQLWRVSGWSHLAATEAQLDAMERSLAGSRLDAGGPDNPYRVYRLPQ